MRGFIVVVTFLVAGCAARASNTHTQTMPPEVAQATPLPVPQPAIARQQMSVELQRLWLRVEQAVEVRPPAPPSGGDNAAIKQWAQGPFTQWILARKSATDSALEATYALRVRPRHEKGIGSGLFGYMYEDMINGVRGAPVPDHIAADPGLLKIYTDTLHLYLDEYARLSARAYYVCVATFEKLGELRWANWAHYCNERGKDVSRTYGLLPGDQVPAPPMARGIPISVRSSIRAAGSSRKQPRSRLVVVQEPGFFTPR